MVTIDDIVFTPPDLQSGGIVSLSFASGMTGSEKNGEGDVERHETKERCRYDLESGV